MQGSIGTEVILWCFFLLPGLLYSLWRLGSSSNGCTKCGSNQLIPLDSPRAAVLLATPGFGLTPEQRKVEIRRSDALMAIAAVTATIVILGLILIVATSPPSMSASAPPQSSPNKSVKVPAKKLQHKPPRVPAKN
jgi:hypothetical protein